MLEGGAVAFPLPSLSQMPNTLDFSSSHSQARTVSTRAFSPPGDSISLCNTNTTSSSSISVAATSTKHQSTLPAQQTTVTTTKLVGGNLEECPVSKTLGDHVDDDIIWIMPTTLANKVSGESKEPKKHPDPGSYGDSDFFLRPLGVPKTRQTAEIGATLTTTASTSSSCFPSKTSTSCAPVCHPGEAASLCVEGSAISRSSDEVSILAPSSLTPSSHDTPCGVEKGGGHLEGKSKSASAGVPHRDLIAELFRGKQCECREPPPLSVDNDCEEPESPAKRQCMEGEVRTDRPQTSPPSPRKGLFGHVTSRRTKRKAGGGEQLEKPSPWEEKACTINSDVGNKEGDERSIPILIQDLDPVQKRCKTAGSIPSSKQARESEKTLDCIENLAEDARSPPSGDNVPKIKTGMEPISNMLKGSEISAQNIINNDSVSLCDSVVKNYSNVTKAASNPSGGRKDIVDVTSTPARGHLTTPSFISSRCKRSLEQPLSVGTSQISVCGTPSAITVDVCTTPFTSLTLCGLREAIPLTVVSMGGRRSKATPGGVCVADTVWMQDEHLTTIGEGGGEEWVENPLEDDGRGTGSSSRSYQPVRDAAGFIMARVPPRLKVNFLLFFIFYCCSF